MHFIPYSNKPLPSISQIEQKSTKSQKRKAKAEVWRFHNKYQRNFNNSFFNLLRDKTAVFPVSAIEQRYLRGIHNLKEDKSNNEFKLNSSDQIRMEEYDINIIIPENKKYFHDLLNN